MYDQLIIKRSLRSIFEADRFNIRTSADTKSIRKELTWRKRVFNLSYVLRDFNSHILLFKDPVPRQNSCFPDKHFEIIAAANYDFLNSKNANVVVSKKFYNTKNMDRKKHQSLLKQVLIYSQLYKIVTFVFFVSIEEHLKTHSKIYI